MAVQDHSKMTNNFYEGPRNMRPDEYDELMNLKEIVFGRTKQLGITGLYQIGQLVYCSKPILDYLTIFHYVRPINSSFLS